MNTKDLNFIHNKCYIGDETTGQRVKLIDEDTDFNISELTHPTSTINLMGEYEIIDYSRLNNFTVTLTLNSGQAVYDIYESAGEKGQASLIGIGRQQRFVNGLLRQTTTEIRVVGNLVNNPALSIAPEQSGGGQLTLNVLKLKTVYTDETGVEYILHDIDRTNDKLVICGIDRRKDIQEI